MSDLDFNTKKLSQTLEITTLPSKLNTPTNLTFATKSNEISGLQINKKLILNKKDLQFIIDNFENFTSN